MTGQKNIQQYKIALRQRMKERRDALPPGEREAADARITDRLRALPDYRRAKTLLCYVSMQSEVGTTRLIEAALSEGKRVYVPYCVPGTRSMEFYEIASLLELSPGTFGVMEPTPNPEKRLNAFGGTLCVVPALCCDARGNRLGYGGGYYDRFLRHYTGRTAAVVYHACLLRQVRQGHYDLPLDWVVTDVRTIRTPAGHKVQTPKRPPKRP